MVHELISKPFTGKTGRVGEQDWFQEKLWGNVILNTR